MNQQTRPQISRYALAVGSVAVAAALTYLLYAERVPLPFGLFYAAVLVSSHYGGRRPGLLSIVIAVPLADYLFLEPRFGFLHNAEDMLRLAVFVSVSLLIWSLTESRRRAGDDLRRRERELTDFFENATVGLHWVGPDGTILWTNRAELEMLGYARDEYIGHNITEFHADDEVIKDILARLSRGEQLHDYEARLRCKDGSVRHVVINSNVLFEGDRFVHTRCFTRDVTDLKRAAEERERLLAAEREARAEAERAAEAVRFQAQLLDTVEQAVIATDARGAINYWNKFAEKLYGWTAEEVLGRGVVEVTPSEPSREQAAEIMRRVGAGESWSGEFTVRRKDGSSFPSSVTLTPITGDGGAVVGVVGVSEDITGRKREEETRRLLSAIVESSDDAILSADLDFRVASWNASAERMFGYTAEEVIGREATIISPPDRAAETRARFERFKTDTAPQHFETVRRAKDGRLVEVLMTLSPLTDERGTLLGVSAVARDIGERKRAEASLREQSEVIEQAYDAIFLRDSSNAITLWNSGAERTYGYTKGEALGRSPHELLKTVTPIPLEEIYADLRGTGYWEGELTHTRKDGEKIVVESRWATVRDDRGEVTSILEIVRDVTERKRANEALREQAEIIETVNRVGQSLAGELDLHKLVQTVTDAATEISNARFGSFFYNVLDEAGESYMLYTLSGVPRSAFAHFPMPRNTDIFAPTFAGEGTVLIPDVKKDPRYGKNSPYYGMPEGHLPVVSYLAVPVVSRTGEVYGGLFFGHPEVGVFTERAARIVEGLAAQAAVAMDNARLFDAVQRERAKAEASEEHYRFLAESIPQIVWTANADGGADYFNQRWYDYTALPRGGDGDAPVGFAAHDIVHPEDLARVLAAWRQAFESGGRFDAELRLRRGSDGSYRWHLARSVPLRDQSGRIVKWFGTSTDIDDRKRAEESQAFLSQASEVLVSSLDYETTLRRIAELVVPRLADWCSVDILTEDRVLRRVAVTHQDPSKIEYAAELERRYPVDMAERQGVPNVVRTGEPELYPNIPDELLALTARDADQLRIMRELGLRSAMIVPLAVQGRVLGAISFVSAESGRHYNESDLAFAEDLAHRAALAVENARLYREAQEVNRLKDEFLATLSHELRTPLTAVLGWTRLLGTGQLDEQTQARALETIERNAQAQVQLIDDILDVSRIIRGKLRLNVRAVELAPVIESAVDSVRPAAEAKGVRLQVVLDRASGPVSGDPDRLQQIVWNLLSNAIKFTPRGGRAQVTLARVDSHLEIAVSDTGQGIAPEFLPYVFDRFRQADPTTTRVHGGLGLGLAIVRHLVELHGGAVKADSEGAGRGATFRVMLPLLAAAAPPQLEPAASAGEADARQLDEGAMLAGLDCPPEIEGLRVLVVEDDLDSRELLVTVLRRCRAEVVAVSGSAEGMRALAEFGPDVLVSDIEMPGEDGYTFIRKVRELPPERGGSTPAAALTAYARAEDRMRALLAGFQIHVPKPVEPAELVTVVASLAGRAKVKS